MRAQPRGSRADVLRSPLALLLAVVLVAGLPAVWSGRWREQLQLSSRRHDAPYVALAFTDPEGLRACPVAPATLVVGFEVTDGLGRRASLPYVVAVAGRTTSGTLGLDDGRTSAVEVTVPAPPTASYTIEVTLPGRPEVVTVSCEAPP